MTSTLGRVYAIAAALVVLFLGWAAVAAHPWDAAPTDPKVAALEARRAQVRHDAAEAKRVVAARWARYERRLEVRRREVRRAWRARRRAEAVYRRRLAVAMAHRRVVVVTVPAGSSGGSYGGSASSGGSGGGYSAPASSGGGSPAAAAAPPVVSVGAAAPVTASGAS